MINQAPAPFPLVVRGNTTPYDSVLPDISSYETLCYTCLDGNFFASNWNLRCRVCDASSIEIPILTIVKNLHCYRYLAPNNQFCTESLNQQPDAGLHARHRSVDIDHIGDLTLIEILAQLGAISETQAISDVEGILTLELQVRGVFA